MNYEQVLVVGGTGQIGHRLIENILKKKEVKIVGTSRAVRAGLPAGTLAPTIIEKAKQWKNVTWGELDFEAKKEDLNRQIHALEKFLQTGKKTLLIIAAAFTNVDACETDPEKCRVVNEANPTTLMYWAQKKFDAKVVFYSTDYVFDGKEGPYTETVKRGAINVYGQSKVNVEEWMERMLASPLIIRTTGVFDYINGSKNFVMQMLDLWSAKKTTRIPSDQMSNPVWADEIARATLELLEKDSKGIFNVAGGSFLNRNEFAELIAEVFGRDKSLIEPVKTSDLAQKAKRPLLGGLKCEKLKAAIGWAPMSARDALIHLKKHNT